jgi:toxin-antitoxin system PIN domain toxin
MIAVDTNILVYAHRKDSPWHAEAADRIRFLAEGSQPWMIPMPCIHEFLSTVTHPRIFLPPSTLEQVFNQIRAWTGSPSLVIQSESPRHLTTLESLLRASRVLGPGIHDARVAAICLDHGVTELWTADRDFLRFPGVPAVNPLLRKQP